MRGVIFHSLMSYAEQNWGADFVDDMLDRLPLSTGGAYTNVGSYPVEELIEMLDYVVEAQSLSPAALQQSLGEYTFGVLAQSYPHLLEHYKTSFDCIYEVDRTVHNSVRKLYPDSETPDLKAKWKLEGEQMTLEYSSSRPLMYFALGLIEGCIRHFGDTIKVEMTDRSEGRGTRASFLLVRHE